MASNHPNFPVREPSFSSTLERQPTNTHTHTLPVGKHPLLYFSLDVLITCDFSLGLFIHFARTPTTNSTYNWHHASSTARQNTNLRYSAQDHRENIANCRQQQKTHTHDLTTSQTVKCQKVSKISSPNKISTATLPLDHPQTIPPKSPKTTHLFPPPNFKTRIFFKNYQIYWTFLFLSHQKKITQWSIPKGHICHSWAPMRTPPPLSAPRPIYAGKRVHRADAAPTPIHPPVECNPYTPHLNAELCAAAEQFPGCTGASGHPFEQHANPSLPYRESPRNPYIRDPQAIRGQEIGGCCTANLWFLWKGKKEFK